MNDRVLMKGNEAIAEAAVRAGCRFFFGYPITPQNEIPEYMSHRLPEVNGTFIQSESEVSAINMVYGAAGCGARVMTSSSSPGISLKQEGLSYICGAELPCLIVNIVRCGPGLGGILPAQTDYYQAVKGGGHGDYRMLVYGPSNVQEAVNIIYDSFDKAEKYRLPVMILGDGMLGQIMEPVTLPPMRDMTNRQTPDWATTGNHSGLDRRIVNSLYINPDYLEAMNKKLYDRYKDMEANEVMFESYMTEDAEIVITAYGTVARIAKSTVNMLREQGIKAGLFRPITLYPFPTQALAELALKDNVKNFLCVELSMGGQMIDDVKIAVNGAKSVAFYGRSGGNTMTSEDIADYIINKEGN